MARKKKLDFSDIADDRRKQNLNQTEFWTRYGVTQSDVYKRQFLLFALLVTLALIAAIVVRQGLFRQTASYSFVANSAQDIVKGQAVRIAGFRVGSVAEVRLQDDGQVAVSMEIDADHMRFITHDACVELRKDCLLYTSRCV